MPTPGFFAHPAGGLAVMDFSLPFLEWQQALYVINHLYKKTLISPEEFSHTYGLLTSPSGSLPEEEGIIIVGEFIQKYPEEFYILATKQKLIGDWLFSQRFMDYVN